MFLVGIYDADTEAEALPYLEPFLKIEPALNVNSTLPCNNFPDDAGTGVDDPVCAAGLSQLLFPVGLLSYNIGTTRALYKLFSDMVTKRPQFNGSMVQFENYAIEGMRAVDPASTAFPHRGDNVLGCVISTYFLLYSKPFKLRQRLTLSATSCRSYDLAYPPSAANDQIAGSMADRAGSCSSLETCSAENSLRTST